MSATATAPLPPAIEVTHLVKTYAGVTAVADISFSVARGEIIGFLGPNGAGKSTTMRILTGYLPATSGAVTICGHSVATQPDEVKRKIGYMPENNPLPEDMRVSEYLYFRGRLKEVPRRKLGPRIDEVLEVCDLKRVRHKISASASPKPSSPNRPSSSWTSPPSASIRTKSSSSATSSPASAAA